MKRSVIFLVAISILVAVLLLASCSSAQSGLTNRYDSALLLQIENEHKSFPSQPRAKTTPDLVKSSDEAVEYYFECSITPTPSNYPVVDVSPHEFTVQDAQRVGRALFGDTQFFEYVYDRPVSSEEKEENLARWESYLSGGKIQDLFKGNEVLIRDYELVLNRFRANYAATTDTLSDSFEMTPCQWTFRPDSFYFGELAEKEPRVIRTIVDSEGVTYRFDVANRTSEDFSVYMISAYLYNELSPNNIDELVQQYELCKSPEPSQTQLQAVEDKVYSVLNALNVGTWKVDDCHSDRLIRGSQEAYVITVRATPVFGELPVIRQSQLTNLRSELEGAQHFYYTDAEFTFSPNGTLLSCTIQSPLDMNRASSVGAIAPEQLLQIAKDHLSRKDIAVYREYYTDDSNANVSAKVYITQMQVGLVRIEIANGKTYRYVPALCLDGSFEIYDQTGRLIMDSSEMGVCRMLAINLLDNSEICFSADNNFTFYQP